MNISSIGVSALTASRANQVRPNKPPQVPPQQKIDETPDRRDAAELGGRRVGPGDGPGRRVGPVKFAESNPSLVNPGREVGPGNGRKVGPPPPSVTPDDPTSPGVDGVTPKPEPSEPVTPPAAPGSLGGIDDRVSDGTDAPPTPSPQEVDPPAPGGPDSLGGDNGTGTGDPQDVSLSFADTYRNTELSLSFEGEVTAESLRWFRQDLANSIQDFVDNADLADRERQRVVEAYRDFSMSLRSLIEPNDMNAHQMNEKFTELFNIFGDKFSHALSGGVHTTNVFA